MADMAKGWALSTDMSARGSGKLTKGKKSKPVFTGTITSLRFNGLVEDAKLNWPIRTFKLTAEGKALLRNGGR